MNGRSKCCDAHTVRDDTGDIICTACGIIQEVITSREDDNDD
jgi:hypothetical protein